MSPTKLIALTLLTLSPALQALPTDRDQPIHIESDSYVLNQKAGITTYTGNVVMDQGSIHINADKIVIYTSDEKVSRVIAIGSPAQFQQKPAEDKAVVVARGNTLNYQVTQDKLSISENAQVEQDGSLISGDKITYNIHRAVVEANSQPNTNTRVKVVLQPQNRNGEIPSDKE